MDNPRPFLLNGEWVVSTHSEVVTNRYAGDLVGSFYLADAAQIERAVAGGARAFQQTRRLSALERSNILLRVSAVIKKREKQFIDLLIREAGKPLDFAKAEVARAQQTFTFAAVETSRLQGEPLAIDASAPGKGHSGRTCRFPIGVIFGITPFNFPLNLVAHKIAPAIASGNAILLKPALKTPLIALLLGEVLVQAGILPGQVNILPFHHDLMGPLFADPRIKMTSFTGSAEVGWKIKALAVKQRVCLELGGNAALIIHRDSDWQKRLASVAAACFGYAGQSCISVQRILLHHEIYDAFRTGFASYVRETIRTGNPAEPGVSVGPMIDRSAVEKVRRWIDAALAAGATALTPFVVEDNLLAPLVLEGVPADQAIACEEAFAPIVVLESYEDFDEALAKVNASRYGLQAGVFTRDLTLAERAYQELEVGGVLINQVPTFRVENMPYGGVKDSGFGREGVRYTIEEMTELKSLIINHNQPS